jgi:hypothetical protein
MKSIISILLSIFTLTGFSQSKATKIDLLNNDALRKVNVEAAAATYLGKKSLKVVDTGVDTEAKFVKLTDVNFKNGIIEAMIAGKPSGGASSQARGFVGIAFRINDDNTKFEAFYLRPTNGRAEDQIRRNHALQYISFPDFPWFKLRKDAPEKYESYVDLVAGEWTKVKIVVSGSEARLFVHQNTQPNLLVQDLKLGSDISGSVGLWIGPGTEAYFKDLRIIKLD